VYIQRRVASAEAEYQKKLSSLFARPDVEFTDRTIKQLQAEGKAFADALFTLKKQSAKELHVERITNEDSKNALLNERDQKALDEAASLGLTNKYSPIPATPVGDGLTRQEERWNDREKKLINIEYRKIRDKNRITRREEKKAILAN